MLGKLVALFLLVSAILAAGALYYLQVYWFYAEVTPAPGQDVLLMPLNGEMPEPVSYADFTAIDADSSPIRYRACFTTTESLDRLRATFVEVESVTPRNAPGWFDCFDAESLGRELEAGTATAFLSIKNVHYGVDRITAISRGGNGYVWHELNDCGSKAYDGTVVGEECPPRPAPES
ncbi:DUF6446 family protein [Sedimentitalea sp. JM2-8]|uniref:DUF6446 family protein n=1 Tax=Sedimentitalea xiamensis TaxID=3050037 RepID=A0ABT7F9Q3_9RHOB|nr:DUF6446 family protein [Sedimentitalea xiamensis]MDK3071845.1 DUF6446 family protein [Sedimentitalea xiamensis]